MLFFIFPHHIHLSMVWLIIYSSVQDSGLRRPKVRATAIPFKIGANSSSKKFAFKNVKRGFRVSVFVE